MAQDDLAHVLVSELSKRGVSPPQQQSFAPIHAAWRTFEQKVPPQYASLGVLATGCSMDDLDNFFRQFLKSFLTPDAEYFQNGASFAFRTPAGNFFFTAQSDSFVVRFPSLLIVIGPKEDDIVIQLLQHADWKLPRADTDGLVLPPEYRRVDDR